MHVTIPASLSRFYVCSRAFRDTLCGLSVAAVVVHVACAITISLQRVSVARDLVARAHATYTHAAVVQ